MANDSSHAASRTLHHQLRSGATSPVTIAGTLNLAARGLAEHRPESAAVIQGTVGVVLRRVKMAAADPSGQPSPEASAIVPFVAAARRETTELLVAALGKPRLRELRAQGAAMTEDQAYTYARTHIDDYLATNPEQLP